MKINYFGNSDIGLVRKENQDCFGKFPPELNKSEPPLGLLFVIADGIGGHAKGKDASNLAVNEIQNIYFSNKFENVADNLKIALQLANSKIYNLYLGEQKFQKMGTTTSAIVFVKDKATIAHVGDSRIYRISHGKIEQLTSDHTLVSEMQKKGILSREEAKSYPNKSILNRAIGIEKNVEVDIIKNISLHPDDIFVLCTDGLAKVTPEEIKNIVTENNPEIACSILINIANQRGGGDNVTVQIIKFDDKDEDKPDNIYETQLRQNKKWLKILIIFFTAIAFIILGIFFFNDIKNFFNSSDNQTTLNSDQIVTSNQGGNENYNLNLLLIKAEKYFNKSEFDSSLSIYKSILRENPMNMSSLSGIYNIAKEYIKSGDVQKNNNNYYPALELYRKALQLQPNDRKIEKLIENCQNALIAQSNQSKESVNNIKDNASDTKTKKFSEKKVGTPVNTPNKTIKSSFWNTEDLLKEDFKVSGNDIKFDSNNRSKKAINKSVLKDVIVNVKVKFNNVSNNSSAGIIIGYNWNKTTSVETYFLFTVVPKKRFVLNEVTDGNKDEILSIPYDSSIMNETSTYLLGVKYFGPWIMLYNGDRLLKAFFNESFIVGKVGLYADPNTDVEFSNFTITPAIDNLNK